MYKAFTGIIGLVFIANLGVGNASATTIISDVVQTEEVTQKIKKDTVESSLNLRYNEKDKNWVPYIPHITTTKKKKNFGVPILNGMKKRAPTIN